MCAVDVKAMEKRLEEQRQARRAEDGAGRERVTLRHNTTASSTPVSSPRSRGSGGEGLACVVPIGGEGEGRKVQPSLQKLVDTQITLVFIINIFKSTLAPR